MKRNNNIYIYLILIIIIILLIISLFYFKKKNIESFFNAKSYILDKCDSSLFDCNNNTWISDPAYLCGLCGNSNENPLRVLKKNNEVFFGCSPYTTNQYGLKWQKESNSTTTNSFLSGLTTCNGFNKGVSSTFYMYICCDDYCSVTVNGSVNNYNAGWNILQAGSFLNIAYGDEITINGTNVCAPGGVAFCYFWNKQLFIMENNGYSTCANIIDFVATGATGWSSEWINDVAQLLPWMKNWITMEYCPSCSGCETTMSISFKVGYTKNKALLNGDLALFWGADDYASILVNGKTVASNTAWTANFQEVTVPKVKERSKIQLNGTNGGGPGGIGLFYIWCGLFYCLPSTVDNFNSAINVIQYTSTNTEQFTYNMTGYNYPFLPMWLNTCGGSCTYSLTTYVTPPTSNAWVYEPTINLWYTPVANNLVGDWSITGITSTASMTVSFWIYISEINPSWRNIFHVSNQNVDCCSVGNRIPAAWICPGNTSIYTRSSDDSWGDNGGGCTATSIPLNTATYVNMVFNNTTITVYFNGNNVQSYTSPSAILNADSSAQFYISDPWYDSGGYQIQNFAIFNTPFSASEISSMYKQLPAPSTSTPIVCGAYNFCVNTENYGENYYCYGETPGCLWNTNDCTTDSDCNKYDSKSPRYTDPGGVCQGLTSTTPGGAWQYNACSNT